MRSSTREKAITVLGNPAGMWSVPLLTPTCPAGARYRRDWMHQSNSAWHTSVIKRWLKLPHRLLIALTKCTGDLRIPAEVDIPSLPDPVQDRAVTCVTRSSQPSVISLTSTASATMEVRLERS